MLVTPMLTPVCSSNRIRVERDDPLEVGVSEYLPRRQPA